MKAVPDVAAQGRRFRVWVNGTITSVAGTSASSPTFSAIVALVNDARIAQGLSPLGFLNPLLYSSKLAGAFNDIVEGNNPGCGTQGFNVSSRWKQGRWLFTSFLGYERVGSRYVFVLRFEDGIEISSRKSLALAPRISRN